MLAFTLQPCNLSGSIPDCPHEGFNLTQLPTNLDIVAASCTLYGCLRSYFAEVNLGLMNETLVSIVPITSLRRNLSTILLTPVGIDILTSLISTILTITPFSQALETPSSKSSLGSAIRVALKIPCFINGVEYDLGNFSSIPLSENHTLIPAVFDPGNITKFPQDCLYRTPDAYFADMSDFMEEVMNGYCGSDQSVSCGSLWWLQRLSDDFVSFATLNDSMNGVSTSATNQLRLIGRDGGGFNPGVVNGTAYQTRVCTHFEGFWLALPSLSILAGAILLSVIMAKTTSYKQNIPVWKSSVLPLLFHGPFWKQERRLTRFRSLDEMEKEANDCCETYNRWG
jgi:hypothetical protein